MNRLCSVKNMHVNIFSTFYNLHNQQVVLPYSILLILALLPSNTSSTSILGIGSDLTDLCCTTEISARISDHAIMANSRDRALVRLYKTPAYKQVSTRTRNSHIFWRS